MSISAVTNDHVAGRMLDDIIGSDGNYTEFQFRRALAEISKIPGDVRRQTLFTILYATIGNSREAKRQAQEIRISRGSADEYLDAASAYHAGNMLTEAARSAAMVSIEDIMGLGVADFALLNAQGTYSFERMELIMQRTNAHKGKEDSFNGSQLFAKMLKKHGIPEDHVRKYAEECMVAVSPWFEGKGKPPLVGHTIDEVEKKAIIDIYVPAEPEEFGDIMVALSAIDKHKYSMAQTHHVMVDAQLYEDA